MTYLPLLALATASAALALPAHAATQIGVSIGINAPGQYGRIDVGSYPQPVLQSPQPLIYAPSAVAAYQRPIYLYVPLAQQANWGRYCGAYRACGQPVYFVKDTWVREQYQHEHEREHDQARGKGHGKGQGRGHDKH